MEALVLEDLEIADMVMEPEQIQRIYQNYKIRHRFAQLPLPPIKKKLKHEKFSSQGATSINKDSMLDICTPSSFFTSHNFQITQPHIPHLPRASFSP
jgi:hypothetical protein